MSNRATPTPLRRRSIIPIDTRGLPLLASHGYPNIMRIALKESKMSTSPKISAKVTRDALRIAIAKALVWTKLRATKPAFSPAATGTDR